jgi:hypothetical protein
MILLFHITKKHERWGSDRTEILELVLKQSLIIQV